MFFLPLTNFKPYRVHPQKPAEVRDILTNDRARAAGIVYLQDESFKFKVKEGGREWSVYGSPVRLFCLPFTLSCHSLWAHPSSLTVAAIFWKLGVQL
jgi:hypothetical protein